LGGTGRWCESNCSHSPPNRGFVQSKSLI